MSASIHSLPGGDSCAGRTPGLDSYAGRTPLRSSSVLLHNARADIVLRMLHRTQKWPDISGSFAEMTKEAPEEENGMVHSPKRVPSREGCRQPRGPFAHVRQDTPTLEKVGPDSFNLVERLGKGSFGEVFLVKHRQTQTPYAMKILRKNKMSGNLLRYTITERNVLSYIHHPYMVSLHYAFQTKSYLVLVLQYCPGGNLQNLIEREKRLQEPLAQLYTAEVLTALSHLHEREIVFRDLKPENVLLDEIGHCMLTDFGLSKEGVSALHGTMSEFCGSVAFLAPEILQRKVHRHTVDIYGLGVLLFDMLTGLPPFYHPDRAKLYSNIKHAALVVPRFVSQPAALFIHALMDREPSNRLGASNTNDVKNHEFFRGFDFEALMQREIPIPLGLLRSHGGPMANPKFGGFKPDSPFSDRGHGGSQDVNGWSFALGSA